MVTLLYKIVENCEFGVLIFFNFSFNNVKIIKYSLNFCTKFVISYTKKYEKLQP